MCCLALPGEELDLNCVLDTTTVDLPGERWENRNQHCIVKDWDNRAVTGQGGKTAHPPGFPRETHSNSQTLLPLPSAKTSQITHQSNCPPVPRGADGAHLPVSVGTTGLGVCTGARNASAGTCEMVQEHRDNRVLNNVQTAK